MDTDSARIAAAAATLIALLAGCAHRAAGTPAAGGGTTAPGTTTESTHADGAGVQAAATKIKDVCTLLPTDLAAILVPGGSPHTLDFPPGCAYGNGTATLQITLGAYDTGGPVNGAEAVPGLAAGGYFERLTPGDAYLTVLLAPDIGALYVEISAPDGKDHRDDTIAVAHRVLDQLR